MQASRILEVGTSYGYSTLWMALAQPRMGRIWTIERDVAYADVAREYFRRAGEDDYIELFNTPAPELLENFPHRNLDIVFIATAPREYDRYLGLVIPMLKLSGLAIFYDCASAEDFVRRLAARTPRSMRRFCRWAMGRESALGGNDERGGLSARHAPRADRRHRRNHAEAG